MKTYIEVRDFGKIKHAKVAYDGFTVFVGDNNSGKSYLMQLVYAVKKKMSIQAGEGRFLDILKTKLDKSNHIVLDYNDLMVMVDDVNHFLAKEKDSLVQRTFRDSIEIGTLRLDLDIEQRDELRIDIGESDIFIPESGQEKISKLESYKTIEMVFNRYHFVQFTKDIDAVQLKNKVLKTIFGAYNPLYLPAARAGIQLLYKDFFASKTDDLFYEKRGVHEVIKLTEPVYDYLRFLQVMSNQNDLGDAESMLVDFIEEKIIDGHVSISDKNEITYSQKNGKANVPLFIASSMIGEIAPIIECILDSARHDYIIIDEIEASLHPIKQREVARLLNRMSNTGYDILVSTHSDSMAAYINNLLIASMKNISDDKLKEMGLEKEDLLLDKDIRFYEFKNIDDGSSIVEELEVQPYPHEGVQFSRFNENIDLLYKDSTNILEVPDEITS